MKGAEQVARCNTMMEHVIDYHTKHGGTEGLQKCIHDPEAAIKEYQKHVNSFADNTLEVLENEPKQRPFLKGEMLGAMNNLRNKSYEEHA